MIIEIIELICIYLRTKIDVCYLLHKLIDIIAEVKCLQRDKDWGYKYFFLRLVFKWLIIIF